MAATLAEALEGATADSEEMHERYGAILRLVHDLLGVVPNGYEYFEIWPVGLRTYSLLIPNMANLPPVLFGLGAPKELVGLAMYTASRAAGCMYCSAHSCTFALRRGLSERALRGDYTEVEAHVAAMAEAIATVPAELKPSHLESLREHLSEGDIEWLMLVVSMMGFLNKFNDTMGIPLEPETVADVTDVISETGWSPGQHGWDLDDSEIVPTHEVPTDDLGFYLKTLTRAPGAIRLESSWTKGVPTRAADALMLLDEEIGYSFPVLASLGHQRPVKALATLLRDNLDPDMTTIGLGAKCLIGLVYARTVGNALLGSEMVQLAGILAPDLPARTLVEAAAYAEAPPEETELPVGLSRAETALLLLARAASTSPTSINEFTVEAVTAELSAEQIVETATWLAVLQTLHRMYVFYEVAYPEDAL
ncbi:MAG: hypothetical protein AAF467_14340 [Actinomycetota bacterium]